MKIYAEFQDYDSAETAASAIRRNISDKYCLNIKSKQIVKDHPPTKYAFSYFNTSNIGLTFAIPVYGYNERSILSGSYDYRSDITGISEKANIEVICKKEEARKVSQYIVSYGGTNLSVF